MQVHDANGNVLWQADDFGSYSIEKIQTIVTIFEGLLTNITLKTSNILDDESMVNIYSKSEVNDLLKGYIELASMTASISDIVNGKIAELKDSGAIYSSTSLDIITIRSRLEEIYRACTGYYLNGAVDNTLTAYPLRLSSLDLITGGHTNSINTLTGVVFRTEGQQTQYRNVALRDHVGEITTLNTVNKNSVVGAINEVFQSGSEFKSAVASAITAKGVSTQADADKNTMVTNIGSIVTLLEGTADATALAEDIVLGKVAYVNGIRIVGTHV